MKSFQLNKHFRLISTIVLTLTDGSTYTNYTLVPCVNLEIYFQSITLEHFLIVVEKSDWATCRGIIDCSCCKGQKNNNKQKQN